MMPVKCPNCRLSLPQNWTGMNDPNAKCPYCGKPLAGRPAGNSQAAPAEAPPPPPPQQPASRPGGPAKTMLWGVGAYVPGMPVKPAADAVAAPVPEASTLPLGAPVSGPSPRPAEPAPKLASDRALRPAFSEAADGLSTAPTENRYVAEAPRGVDAARPAPSAAVDASSVEVEVAESFEPPVATAKPAPTVMFDRESSAAPSVGKMVPSAADFMASAPGPADPGEEDESAADEEPGEEPKPRGRPVSRKGRRRAPAPQKWGSPRADVEDDAEEARPSSKRTIIVVAAVAAAVVVLVAVAVLRGGKKAEEPATGQTAEPANAEPAKAEPATNEEPPLPAAKPAPEPAKPAAPARPAVAEQPTPSEKAGRGEKPAGTKPGHAERTEHTGRVAAEGRVPSDKGKPAASASTTSSSEPKSGAGTPSEVDYQRANDVYQRGNAKLFKGDTAGAIADFNQALRLNPRDPTIHRGLGLAYAQAGKSAEAVRHLKTYLKEAPKANDRATIQKRIDQLRGR
jgi:hypothetical protein